MTAAFSEFMRQYKMTGSEKADGYSQSAFIGLDEHEKEEVFNILATELPYSVQWLFFLNKERALPLVKQEEKKLRGDGYARVYMLQEELLDHTGDLSYQKHMIEDYPGYVDYLKPLVVDAVGRTPPTVESVSFLKQVILTETDSDAVARAARRLLNALKVPRVTEADQTNYRKLIGELRSDNIKEKLNVFMRLTKLETELSSNA